MARINLLPWREVERQRRQRDFVTLIGISVAATIVIGIAVQIQFAHAIEAQTTRNNLLSKEIAQLEAKIKKIEELEKRKQDLLARMGIIQQLQESRPTIVRLFDELVRVMPEGVFLDSLKQTGGNLEVEGSAQSNARVSTLMRNIEQSEWIEKPQLLLIENKDKTGTGLSQFRMSFRQKLTEEAANTPPPSKNKKTNRKRPQKN
ncbi:PilN domain-containing protein [Thiospirillum jenense]|uniref:PilN domain-containing protein n=1 Tax=Thiospirillum jenense TaxID=1653858 RepID=A0A839H875_9GAMM|nr:PilN domain-containing protein [Thiospirillum jenense]MBB1125665.1 PilN domain-containing protein [Thiospirillum jenense]